MTSPSPSSSPVLPGPAAPSRKTPVLVGIAFVVGVLGTAAVMSARNPAAPASTTVPASTSDKEAKTAGHDKSKEEAKDSGSDAETSATVTLDPDAAQKAGVRAEPVTYRSVGDILTVPGTVEISMDRVARVTPPVAGKVTRVLVHPGDSVQAGQSLALLESYDVAQAQAAARDSVADLQQAEAALRTVETTIAQAGERQASAEIALGRQKELARAGAFSQAPLQAAQTEQSQAASELLSAQAEQQQAAAALARSEKLFQAGVDSRAELEQGQTTARQAQIRTDQAQARVTLANQALEREQKIYGRDLLSQREVQSAEADVRAARGDVQRAQAEAASARVVVVGARQKVSSARTNLAALAGGGTVRFDEGGKVTLLSPVSGNVSDLSVTLGQAVERTAALMTIENLSGVVVQASVPEKSVSLIRAGQRADVTVPSFPHTIFHGIVQSLGSQMDEKTRALPVRILVDNPGGRLRPEMFARIQLVTSASHRALVVPVSALVNAGESESDGKAVYVAGDKAGIYEKRPVTTGKTYIGDRVEIVGGLRPEDRVVVKGAFVLRSEASKSELKDED